ncbi:MAG: hypothetical protein CME25_04345 [Gemmatimonadetes bacterium]|nr:hypothetical protein [Gemmatimonadota bacterium]
MLTPWGVFRPFHRQREGWACSDLNLTKNESSIYLDLLGYLTECTGCTSFGAYSGTKKMNVILDHHVSVLIHRPWHRNFTF